MVKNQNHKDTSALRNDFRKRTYKTKLEIGCAIEVHRHLGPGLYDCLELKLAFNVAVLKERFSLCLCASVVNYLIAQVAKFWKKDKYLEKISREGRLIIMKDDKNTELYLIADIGVNYYDIARVKKISLMESARLMIKEAKEAGCSAVKFQSFKAEKIAVKDSPSYCDVKKAPTNSQYELFKKFDKFNEKEFIVLKKYCDEIEVDFLCTPFDFEAVDYLAQLGVKYFKIASGDLNNLPFIKYIATKNIPMILSTGASTIQEIEQAIEVIQNVNKNLDICILHCVLSYPTNEEDANLNLITILQEKFPEHSIGYSDHTKPDASMFVLTYAYCLGARIIEKHFTLDKNLKGNDHYHSMQPDDIRVFINNVNRINKISGNASTRKVLPCEIKYAKNARRSIVTRKNIKVGERIALDKVTFKRPGTGIPPNELNNILNKEVVVDIPEDTIIRWDMIKMCKRSGSVRKGDRRLKGIRG